MVRAIYEYWERKRGDRLMPARRDIDPTEFVPHLPGIMLVDVVADERRYVYRLVGTQDPEKIRASFRAYVRSRLPADATATFTDHAGSPALAQ